MAKKQAKEYKGKLDAHKSERQKEPTDEDSLLLQIEELKASFAKEKLEQEKQFETVKSELNETINSLRIDVTDGKVKFTEKLQISADLIKTLQGNIKELQDELSITKT